MIAQPGTLEGSLPAFIEEMRRRQPPRVAGHAVFPHPTRDTTPLALRANVTFNGVLHERVVIVSVRAENVPYVPLAESIGVDSFPSSTSIRAGPSTSCPASSSRAARTTTCRGGRSGYSPG